MSIQVTNVNAWLAKTKAQRDRIKKSATEHVQEKVRQVVKDAMKVSPQWSGDFAYNWSVVRTNYPSYYRPYYRKSPTGSYPSGFTPYKAGTPEPINKRMAELEDNISSIAWNSKVSIVNNAPVAELIESNRVALRPENFIPGGLGVAAYLKSKYKFLR